MSRYLVEASCQRVAAYRSYREQLGEYWTMRRLERMQWEYLYGLVTIDTKYGGKNRHIRPTPERVLLTLRTLLCASMALAEELVPLKILDQFFAKHEECSISSEVSASTYLQGHLAFMPHRCVSRNVCSGRSIARCCIARRWCPDVRSERVSWLMEGFSGGAGIRVHRLPPSLRRRGTRRGVCHAQVPRALRPSVYAWLSTDSSAARVSQHLPEDRLQILGDVWQLVVVPALPLTLLQRSVFQRGGLRRQANQRHARPDGRCASSHAM